MEATTRKPIAKEMRLKAFLKYNEHCAYCGCGITLQSFQVDHLHPFCRSHFEPDLDPDRIENLMPACRKCNNFKGAFGLELYRSELELQVKRLKKNAQFIRALKFKQIEITEKPIVFYFETLALIDEANP